MTQVSSEPKLSRVATWRAHSFGPASEQPYRRRTSDWIRLVIGASIFAACIAHYDHPSAFELNLFNTVNGLPDSLESAFRLVYALGLPTQHPRRSPKTTSAHLERRSPRC